MTMMVNHGKNDAKNGAFQLDIFWPHDLTIWQQAFSADSSCKASCSSNAEAARPAKIESFGEAGSDGNF